MRLLPALGMIVAWALLCGSTACGAQPSALSRELHPWGRFSEGAWKRSREVTETYDEQGRVNLSTTQTKRTSLTRVEPDGVVLLVEAILEIAGKQLTTEPKAVKQGFHGESADAAATVREAGAGEVIIDGRRYPCQIEEVRARDASGSTITRIYYSTTLAPYVLRRERSVVDAEGKGIAEETYEVVSLNMPCKILTRVRPAIHVKAVAKDAKGTTTETYAFLSVDVPGGLVCHVAKEFDGGHRVIRKSTMELVDYGFEPEKDRPGFLGRIRRHRAQRSSTP